MESEQKAGILLVFKSWSRVVIATYSALIAAAVATFSSALPNIYMLENPEMRCGALAITAASMEMILLVPLVAVMIVFFSFMNWAILKIRLSNYGWVVNLSPPLLIVYFVFLLSLSLTVVILLFNTRNIIHTHTVLPHDVKDDNACRALIVSWHDFNSPLDKFIQSMVGGGKNSVLSGP